MTINLDNGTKNWLKVVLALKQLKAPLLLFVSQHITTLHYTIITKCGKCTSCTTEHVLQCPTENVCQVNPRTKICRYHYTIKPKRCQNGICQNVRDEIVKNHVLRNPTWRNTDATTWSSDPWEMAKCFLPPGYAGVHSAGDTDCTGILSLCLHIRPIEQSLTNRVKRLVDQNHKNRNAVIHSGTQTLTDAERARYIQDAIKLLKAFQPRVNPDTQKCIDNLMKLDAHDFQPPIKDCVDAMNELLEPIKQSQELLKIQVNASREAEDIHGESIEMLQNRKVDQSSYTETIKRLDGSLATIKSILKKLEGDVQSEVTKIKVEMEEIRKRNENMMDIISGRIDIIENEMKQLKIQSNEHSSEIKSLRTEISTIDSQTSEMSKQTEGHGTQLDALHSEVGQMKLDMTKHTQSQEIQLDAMESKMDSSHAKHEEEITRLGTRTSRMETQMEDQNIQIAAMKNIEKRIDKQDKLFNVAVDEDRFEMKSLRTEVSTIDSNQQHNFTVLYSRTSEMSKQTEGHGTQLDALHSEVGQMKLDMTKHIHSQEIQLDAMEPKMDSSHTEHEENFALLNTRTLKMETQMEGHNIQLKEIQNKVEIVTEISRNRSHDGLKKNPNTVNMDKGTSGTAGQDDQIRIQDRKRLRNHLVNIYKKTCSTLPVAPPKTNMLADIKDHYRKQDMRQVEMPHEPKGAQGDHTNIKGTGKSEGDQEDHKCTVVDSYHDIFSRKGKACQNIYIKGEAGSGKSVFCKNMVNKWCNVISSVVQDIDQTNDDAVSNQHDIHQSEVQSNSSCKYKKQNESGQSHKSFSKDQDRIDEENASLLRKFEFLFYIELRCTTTYGDIESMIKEILFKYKGDLVSVLADVLQNHSEKCLVLLDGLDEWTRSQPAPHVTRGLPGRDITSNWTILTTTRPWKFELIRPESGEMDQLIELSGFTRQSTYKCILSVVQYLNDRYHTSKSAGRCLIDLIGKKTLRHVMTLPVLLKQLVCIWFDEGQVGDSQCDIYAGLIDVYLKYSAQRHEHAVTLTGSHFDSLPLCLNKRDTCKTYTSELYSLCKLAFHTLFCEDRELSLVFTSTATDICGMSKAETDVWLDVGLLSQDIVDRGSAADHKKLSFPHKSIQEFLAAVYISVCDDENTLKSISDVCTSEDMVMEMSQVFVFVAGMKPSAFTKISEHIAKVADRDNNVRTYRTDTSHTTSFIKAIQVLMLKCIKESKANHHIDIAINIHDIIFKQEHTLENSQLDLIRLNIAENVRSISLKSISLKHGQFEEVMSFLAGAKGLEKITLSHMKCVEHGNACVCQLDLTLYTALTKLELDSVHGIGLQGTITTKPNLQGSVELSNVHTTVVQIDTNELRLHKLYINELTVNPTRLVACKITDVSSNDSDHRKHDSALSKFECSSQRISVLSTFEFIGTAECLRFLYLSNIALKHDQLHSLMVFVTRTSCLRKITLSELRCVDHGETRECQMDLMSNQHMQIIKLDRLHVDSVKVRTIGRRLDPDWTSNRYSVNMAELNANVVQINTDSLTLNNSRVNELIVDPTELKDCSINQHMQIIKLDRLHVDSVKVRTIGRRLDPDWTSNRYSVNMAELNANVVQINTDSLTLNNSRVNELIVDPTELKNCSITNISPNNSEPCKHGSTLNAFEFIGTGQSLISLTISNITLKHDQLKELMSFMARVTSLQNITLSKLRYVDHGGTCEGQLDLIKHKPIKMLKINRLHENALKVQTMEEYEYLPKWSLEVFELHANSVQIKTYRLTSEKSRVNELKVDTTHMVKCTITDVSPNNESGQHECTLSVFEFIGTAQRLVSLTINNIALNHDQLQGLMSFVSRATNLQDITLSELMYVDHGCTCECQLDLMKHKPIKMLKINRLHVNALKEHTKKRYGYSSNCSVEVFELHANSVQIKADTNLTIEKLHVNELKVDTTHLEKCTITDVSPNNESGQHDYALSVFEFIGTTLRLISLTISNITLKHDQLKEFMSFMARATSLQNITLSKLRYVDHGGACEGQLDLIKPKSIVEMLDLRKYEYIHILKINRLHENALKVQTMEEYEYSPKWSVEVLELHANSVQIKTYRLTSEKSRVNELKVDTTHMVKCTITDVSPNNESGQHECTLSVFEFIGTAQRLVSLTINNIALKHDQLQGLALFMARATRLREITLSELRCVDHGGTCEGQLDLMTHESIEMLKINRLHVNVLNIETMKQHGYSPKCSAEVLELHANSVQIETCSLTLEKSQVSELKVDTKNLVKCIITDVSPNNESGQHECTLSVFEFIGTAQRLVSLTINNIALKHDQLQGLMSFVSRATNLQDITLSELMYVDHGCTCECQLDLMKHKPIKMLKINRLHVNALKEHTKKRYGYSSNCSVEVFELHANSVQIKADTNLTIEKLYVNELKVDTTHLEKCTITDVSPNNESGQHECALSVFEFIGTAQRLVSLTINNITLKHDQLQGLALFRSRATLLREITLSELRCVDHGNTCVWQLDLTEHTSLDKLVLDRLHVKEIKVNIKHLKKCTITDVNCSGCEPRQHDASLFALQLMNTAISLTHLELRNINLRHYQLQRVISFVTRTTHLRQIILSELHCTDHANNNNTKPCRCQLSLLNHKRLKKVRLNCLHINEIEVNAQWLTYCKLTNLRSSAINLIPPTGLGNADGLNPSNRGIYRIRSSTEVMDMSWPWLSDDDSALEILNVGRTQPYKWLVLRKIQMKHEQLDGIVTFVTQNKDHCEISLHEIKCNDCDEECSLIAKLQQLVECRPPGDDTDDDGDDDDDNFDEDDDGGGGNDGGECGSAVAATRQVRRRWQRRRGRRRRRYWR